MNGRADMDRLLGLAHDLAQAAGRQVFGGRATGSEVQFGLKDVSGRMYCEVSVTRGGMLTVLTSNGYEFIDIDTEWDTDGTPSPMVHRAVGIFQAFTAGDFRLESGWRTPDKYMHLGKYPISGKRTRQGIGVHAGGPWKRAYPPDNA